MTYDEAFKLLNKITEQELNEMAQIGEFDTYAVWVRTNDPGNIPHFHVWDINTHGDKFHTCVRLDKPEYFHHNGKEDSFNSKEKKELMQFLSSIDIDEEDRTYWQTLVIEWNRNNSSRKVDKNLSMPDYRLLN
jgi:hypothetical protein